MTYIMKNFARFITVFIAVIALMLFFMPVGKLHADISGNIEINNGDVYTLDRTVTVTVRRDSSRPRSHWVQLWESGKWTETVEFHYLGSNEENFSFTFTPGDDSKTLWAAFSFGGVTYHNNTSDSIIIDTTDPVAEAGGPYTGDEKNPVSFDGSGSSDANGIVKYEWDFGSGFSDFGATPQNTWDDPFTGQVTLRVTDAAGRQSTDTADVTINNVPPVADAGGPYSGDEGSDISFSASGSTGQGLTLFEWDFGSGFESLGEAFTKKWDDNTSGTVTLRITDEDGETAEDTAGYTVNNVSPVADAGGPYSGLTGDEINISGSFTDQGSADTITQWEWDMDYDGSIFNIDKTGQDITGQWADNGTYTIALKVTDDDGAVSVPDTAEVTINNREPSADAGGPYDVDEGSSVALDGSGSGDADGMISEYAWDLDNDGVYDDATGQDPVFDASSLDGPSTVNISLKVTDDDGAADTEDSTITVHNVSPSADAGGDYDVNEGSTISLSGSASDPCPSDTLTYTWDLDNDGVYDDATGQDPVFDASSLDGPSTVNISLKVTDDDGAADTEDSTITVHNVSPSADAGGPYEGFTLENINISGIGMDPCALDTLIFEWDIDYDGITFDVDATGENITNSWPDDGLFEIALRVTDDDGAISEIKTAEVVINNRAPKADAGGPYSGKVNSTINFDGSGSSDNDGSISGYSWDFGDGSSKVLSKNAKHSYNKVGTYIATLTVTDNDGARSKSSAFVTVTEIPATITVAGLTDEGNIDVLGLTELPYTGINPFIPLSGIAVIGSGLGIFIAGVRRRKKKQ
jgi:PKD repeat protein